MDNLKLTRIDFRLIHGQVMTRWVKQYGITDIVVVHDKSAKSPILKKILLNAAPAGMHVFVESTESAAQKWKNNQMPSGNLMLLFKDPAGALAAWKAGVDFKRLQVGGIEGAGDKKNICRNITMNQDDINNLKPMYDGGVEIYCQPIPEDVEYPFAEALKKF